MALPILRETQMTTVHVEHGVMSDVESRLVAAQISVATRIFFHS
jgi:hypothetical protein